jgi:stearoyl-CoA desaturase (delta-9 desaturase)
VSDASTESPGQIYLHRGTIPFWTIHLVAIICVAVVGFSWSGLALALGAYVVRMLFVTAGYHRYFSHRSFKTSRWFQFVLAFGAQSAAQRGVFWWAAQHRAHHRGSDTDADPHSSRRGFWWSHMGWLLSNRSNDVDLNAVRDLAVYPELRVLNRSGHLPALLLALAFLAIGGTHALVWGFFVSTVLLWHGTFTINSLSHIIGRRRYATSDDSRNNWLLALITMGEGWHNNHHHYMGSVRQGFFWWEVDVTSYVLRGLAFIGVIEKLHRPPAHIVEGRLRRGEPVTELI